MSHVSPSRHAWDIRALFRTLRDHRHLLLRLVRRDIAGRYKGSAGGIGWAVLTPLVMLGVYLFVFGVVFNPRRGGTVADLTDFGLSLFCGVVVFSMFSECVTRSNTSVVGQPNFVKKVVFPIEILPLVTVGSALFHLAIGIGLVLLALLSMRTLSPMALLLPLTLLPLVLLCMGLAWLVAALAVYLRDIGQLSGLLVSMLMFLSPVFYPISAVPESVRPLMQWNPLTIPIEVTRGVLLNGKPPPWLPWAVHAIGCFAIAWLGFAFFQKTRKGFADVL
jgi:lipopolysaccharide transport system permease protein